MEKRYSIDLICIWFSSKQQTRAASKTYRQRKKALETDLMERVEKLESEKRALLERLQVSEDMISKLNNENMQIRHAQVNEAAQVSLLKKRSFNARFS